MPAKKRKAESKQIDLTPGPRGEFTEKVKGKQPSQHRPEFNWSKFDLSLLGEDIDPPLEKFFQALNVKKNAKIFRDERRQNKKVRRGTIYSILALQEVYYPTYTKGCNSDLQCIQHLLESDLVTQKNVVAVYQRLRELLVPVLYEEDDVQALSTKIGEFLNALRKHAPWGPEIRQKLITDRIFVLKAEEVVELKTQKADARLKKLKHTTKVPDVILYERVRTLKKITDQNKKDEEWVTATIQLLQVATGMRFIEAAVLTVVKLSSDDKYDPALYLEFHGLAKQRRETEDGELDEDEDVEFNPLGLIVKPVLWDQYGVTPQYVVDTITNLRVVIGKTIGAEIKPNDKIMDQVRSHYLGKTIAHFDKLWQDTGIDFKKAKTHAWRKLYGADSHLLYNKDGNLNYWLMQVLGHMSISTSLSYANVVIVTFPNVPNKDVSQELQELRSKVESDLEELKAEIEKKASYNHVINDNQGANLVSLPADQEGADNILVEYINMPRKRFKKDQEAEKQAYLKEWTERTEQALAGVDISKLKDDDHKRLGITQDLLRKIKKRVA